MVSAVSMHLFQHLSQYLFITRPVKNLRLTHKPFQCCNSILNSQLLSRTIDVLTDQEGNFFLFLNDFNLDSALDSSCLDRHILFIIWELKFSTIEGFEASISNQQQQTVVAICFCYSIIIWRFPSRLNPQNPLLCDLVAPRVSLGQELNDQKLHFN